MIRLPRAHVTRLEELSERLTGVEFPFEAPSNPSLRELLAAHTRYLDFHGKFADKRFRYELSHVQPPDFLDFSEETNWKVLILSRRWEECRKCVTADAPLAAIVMMGSLLEALFVARANRLQPKNKSSLFLASSVPIDFKTTSRRQGQPLAAFV